MNIPTRSGDITAEYNIVQRIKDAADLAKRDLDAPPPVLVVEKQVGLAFLVTIEDERLLIQTADCKTILFDESVDKFRAVLFLYCQDCRVFILSKVLKLAVIQCNDCQFSVRGGVIGLVELFRCRSINVDVRSSFPLLTLELCNAVHIYQRLAEAVYGILGVNDCSVTRVNSSGERIGRYTLEDLFSSRRFYCLGPDGIKWIEEPYVLNNVQAHLIALPEDDELPFGQTPPKVGYFTFSSRSGTPRSTKGSPHDGWGPPQ